MKPRFLILLAIAIGLAVYFASKKNPVPAKDADERLIVSADADGTRELIDIHKKTLCERPLPGNDPPEKPQFDVHVEVDSSGKKNRLYLFISERHGYYVESLDVMAWYKGPGMKDPQDSPLKPAIHKELYIKSNETLRTCMEIVPAELRHIHGNIGTSANWEAEVTHYCRAREKNPDVLPMISGDMGLCD